MFTTLAMLLSLSGAAAVTPAASSTQVDVALVLAVDMSGSMDIEEARVQRLGYVDALRHAEFINAVTAGLNGRIAMSYFEWAGSVNETSLVEWHLIDDAGDAAAFAERIAARPVYTRRGTSISNAIAFASKLIATNPYDATRRVIDVSGDGPNNIGPPVDPDPRCGCRRRHHHQRPRHRHPPLCQRRIARPLLRRLRNRWSGLLRAAGSPIGGFRRGDPAKIGHGGEPQETRRDRLFRSRQPRDRLPDRRETAPRFSRSGLSRTGPVEGSRSDAISFGAPMRL